MSKIQSESNSQLIVRNTSHYLSCDRYVKDTIWKQFTTGAFQYHNSVALWSVCQRYNLKAIHNYNGWWHRQIIVVIGMSKIQSESNSQQPLKPSTISTSCDRYVKDTIWKQFTTATMPFCCIHTLWSVCQRYNLKAIHNKRQCIPMLICVVIGMSKIQSESNSQQIVKELLKDKSCDRYVKDTIWKQFTTSDGPTT